MKVVILVALLFLALVAADYLGWLGTHTDSEPDYFGVVFKAEDDQSGESITDFFINCTRSGSRNACSIEQGMKKASREAKFGIIRLVEKTWLFHKSESVVGEDEVDVHMMFIHPDYDRRMNTYSMKQLLSMQYETITVKLKRSSE